MKKYLFFLLFFGCSSHSAANDLDPLYDLYGKSFSWVKNVADTAYVATRCLAHYELLLESLPKKYSQMQDNERLLYLYLTDSSSIFSVEMKVSKGNMGFSEDSVLQQLQETKISYKNRVSVKNITNVANDLALLDFRFCRLADGAMVFYHWHPTPLRLQ